RTYLSTIYGQQGFMPGTMHNQPVLVLNRWQNPVDLSEIQRFTTVASSEAYQVASKFASSNGIYGDASYVRLKNLAFSYSISGFLKGTTSSTCRFYLLAQNIWTITKYKGADPESQNFYTV